MSLAYKFVRSHEVDVIQISLVVLALTLGAKTIFNWLPNAILGQIYPINSVN